MPLYCHNVTQRKSFCVVLCRAFFFFIYTVVTFSQLCTVRPHTARYAVVATWVICRNAVPPLSLAFRGAQPGHTPSGLLMALTPPSRQKIHWLIGTGQFIVNCHATIHAGLLNLLSPDTFSEDKMVKNASSSGTRLGAYKLQRPPDSLAGLRGGREKENEGRGRGERREGEGKGERGRGGVQGAGWPPSFSC